MLAIDPATFDLDAALAHFAEHGYARLGRVLSDAGIAALSTRTDDLMHARVTHDGLFFQHDAATGRYEDLEFGAGWRGPSPNYRKLEKLERDPIFRAWIENPLNARIAHAVYGAPVSLYRAVLFTKSASGGTRLPWHQDGGIFWGIDRQPVLQIWTALDDCSVDAGCVDVIPGTHKSGLATPQGGVIPDALLLAANAEQRALALPVVAGEGLLIHNLLWHRSGINRTGVRRSALSVCVMDAATRCRRKRGTPREFTRLF